MSNVWFITGAGSGIGAGAAKAALQAGNKVVATGRNLDKVRRALADVASDNLALVPLDVTDAAQAEAAVAEAVRRFGRIDVLVTAAGYSFLGNFEEITVAELQQQFATNFYGVVHTLRAVLPVMRQQRAGHILNISSSAGVVGYQHCGAYGASKFAVEGLTLSLVPELAPFNIKLTIVEPGFFRTDLLHPQNVRFATPAIADYAGLNVQQLWEGMNGTQQGDPDKLGEVLLELTQLENPPKVFVAGSDALAGIVPAIEDRLRDSQGYEALSTATDGSF